MLIISFNNSHNVMQLSYTFCHFPMDVLKQKQERERERERGRESEGERERGRESKKARERERESIFVCVFSTSQACRAAEARILLAYEGK